MNDHEDSSDLQSLVSEPLPQSKTKEDRNESGMKIFKSKGKFGPHNIDAYNLLKTVRVDFLTYCSFTIYFIFLGSFKVSAIRRVKKRRNLIKAN